MHKPTIKKEILFLLYQRFYIDKKRNKENITKQRKLYMEKNMERILNVL